MPDLALKASLGCGNPTALAELKPGETVLDLGSGGGIDVLLSARRVGPTGQGVRPRHDRRDARRRRGEQAQERPREREFLKGEIEHIPLPDNSVDVIISNCVINLSGDKDRVLREAFRVLKPGGRFAVSDVVVRGDVPDAIKKNMELWIGCVAGALERSRVHREAREGRLRRDRHRRDPRLHHRGRADVSRRRRPRRRCAGEGRGGHVHQRVRPRHEAGGRGVLRAGLLQLSRPDEPPAAPGVRGHRHGAAPGGRRGVRASWASGSPAGTSRSRSSPTRSPRARRWWRSSSPSGRFRARTSIRR